MHPLNPYALNPPDFLQLAAIDPALARSLVPSISNPAQLTIDFLDPVALRQLTIALLKRDFDLTLSLPENRLCPAVPARLDYCLWTIDLLKSSWTADDGQWDPTGDQLLAIDIGTGASAIYSLLLARLLPKLKCIATEIDPLSATSAQLNVSQNGLSDTITCFSPPSASILPLPSIATLVPPMVAFTLCNPPFYSSRAEMDELSAKKARMPSGTCTGTETEMVTEGGEEKFIAQMVAESCQIEASNVRWFTSLCGKYSTLAPTIALYKSLGGNNYAVTELRQGRTNRWAFGWSWQAHRASDNVARSLGKPGPRLKDSNRLVPPPNTIEYHFPQALFGGKDFGRARTCVSTALDAIEELTYDTSQTGGGDGQVYGWKVTLKGQSWRRSARRKRKRTWVAELTSSEMERLDGSEMDGQKEQSTMVLDIKLRLVVGVGCRTTSQMGGNSRVVKRGRVEEEIDYQHKKHNEEIISSDDFDDNMNDQSEKYDLKKEVQEGQGRVGKKEGLGMKIEMRWVKGKDRIGFEGFWNHLVKKIRVLGEESK